jgi:hypothetical protein
MRLAVLCEVNDDAKLAASLLVERLPGYSEYKRCFTLPALQAQLSRATWESAAPDLGNNNPDRRSEVVRLCSSI